MYKVAIFDLDGTLLDTLKDLADACNFALRSYGFPEHQIEEYKYFLGNGAYKLIERALPIGKKDAETIGKVLGEFKKYYEKHKSDFTKPYDGIEDLLIALKEAGIKTAVVSNKPHEFAVEIVERYFAKSFDIVFGKREGYLAKPDPTTVIETLNYFKCKKEEAVYIGDSDVDMFTGKNAGLFSIGVAWGFRGARELSAAGANKIVYTSEELLSEIIK